MNIIARLIFVTSLNPRFGIGICFASALNSFNPTSSLAYAGPVLITNFGPMPNIPVFPTPAQLFQPPDQLYPQSSLSHRHDAGLTNIEILYGGVKHDQLCQLVILSTFM